MKPKPCPFCGCAAGVAEQLVGWRVYCKSGRCGADGPVRYSKRGAIAAWNRREEKP